MAAGIYDDALVDGLRQMTDAVHAAGGRILVQLAHAGHFALEKAIAIAPRVVSDFDGLAKTPRHELSVQEIEELKGAYVAAARRAQAAGFDGIELHSAHGYLFSQFLSPWFNRRTDTYGGSIENRTRVHVETLAAMRAVVGADYPLLIKINCSDFADGGLTEEESLSAVRRMVPAGLDAIELSGGLLTGGKLSPSRPAITTPEKEPISGKRRGRQGGPGCPADSGGRHPFPRGGRKPFGRRQRRFFRHVPPTDPGARLGQPLDVR